MITDIIKNGERVGVAGRFRLDGNFLRSDADSVGEIGLVPNQWIAIYRPAGRLVRLWRWLRGGDPEVEIGFARVECLDKESASLRRAPWRAWHAKRDYSGSMSIYLSRVHGQRGVLPPRTCPDCAHDPGKCIHPMDFTEINELLRKIREQARQP